MDNLLGIMILVLPGIIGHFVSKQIGPTETKPKSDYEKTIIGLLLSLPGLIICWIGYSIIKGKYTTFAEFHESILKLGHFLMYVSISFIISLLIVLIWDIRGRKFIGKQLNRIRKINKHTKGSDISAWEAFIGLEESGFFRIYPIGEKTKFVLGEIYLAFLPGETEKGILLSATEELSLWNDYFPSPERTYVDIISKIVYEFFPTSAWEEAKSRANSQLVTQSS